MAGGANGDDEEGINGINVTPLVDITLVLLIIFMVTASYIVKETIEIELPRAAHGGETVQKTFAVLAGPVQTGPSAATVLGPSVICDIRPWSSYRKLILRPEMSVMEATWSTMSGLVRLVPVATVGGNVVSSMKL